MSGRIEIVVQFLSSGAIGTRGPVLPVIRDRGAGLTRLLVMAARPAEAITGP